MRLPVIGNISTKDGATNKNARLTNMLAEQKKNGTTLATVRPGLNQVASTTGNGNGLVCFNGNLVSVWDAQLGISSEEEITWTELLSGGSPLYNVIYANGKFVRLSGTSAYTSIDGVTWNTHTSAVPNQTWQAIAWNGTVFCAVGHGGAGSNVCATSSDGITWTPQTISASLYWHSIAWNGAVFCAIATSGTSACATSPDGATWTARTMSSSQYWYEIAWNGAVFCASSAGTTFATSPDGATWTDRTVSLSGAWWGLASNGTDLIACASNTAGVGMKSTNNGVSWSNFAYPISASWRCVKYYAGEYYVSGYSTKTIMISVDGDSWDTEEIPNVLDGNIELLDLASSGSSLVVVGGGADYVLGVRESGITYHETTITDGIYDFALIP